MMSELEIQSRNKIQENIKKEINELLKKTNLDIKIEFNKYHKNLCTYSIYSKLDYIDILIADIEDVKNIKYSLISNGKYKKEVSYFNKKNKEGNLENLLDFFKLLRFLESENNLEIFSLKNINLKNYRKYENQTFNFESQFSLLVGENSTGKTTVLDSIAVSIGGFLQGISQIKSLETHGIKPKDMRKDYLIENNLRRVINHENTSVKSLFVINDVEVSWERYLKNIKGNTTLSKVDSFEVYSIAKVLNIEEKILPIFSYHGTGRVWEQEKKVSSKMENLKRIDAYKDCLKAKSNYRNFLSWFEKLSRAAFEQNEKIEILEEVKLIIVEALNMLKENENKSDNLVTSIIYREGDLEVYYENKKIDRVGMLSDGYRNIIGIVSDIAYRISILNPNLKEKIRKTPGLVLIDEIDLHLHPKWQRKIVKILKTLFPKIQFIATSHSPFIVQSMNNHEIIRLDEDKVDIAPDYTDPAKMSVEDISEGIMGIEMPQMSERKKNMLEVANRYYDLLDGVETSKKDKNKLDELKTELDGLLKPFEDNMAYVAFLERQRLLKEIKTVKE